jgi:hypothetical protein
MLSADHGLLQCESRRDGKLRLVMGDWAAADVSEQEGPGSARRSGGAGTIVSLDGLERI